MGDCTSYMQLKEIADIYVAVTSLFGVVLRLFSTCLESSAARLLVSLFFVGGWGSLCPWAPSPPSLPQVV